MSKNLAIIIGNVGQDPEIKLSGNNNMKIARFSVATTDQKDKTSWHNVVCFDRVAEIVEAHIKKGSKVSIFGRIDYNSYEKDGQQYNYTNIVANSIEFMSQKVSQGPFG